MRVEAITIGPSEALAPVESVHAVAGCGLEGDRHFRPEGARPGEALTLIEAEVLEEVGLTGPQSRRQVVVSGVRLNDLVGKRFTVGGVECVGVELCEPCLHLESLTRPGLIDDLVHRGGLNADVLNDGTICVGDAVDVGTAASTASA
jgi:MOSC domain-containing protein YiiM